MPANLVLVPTRRLRCDGLWLTALVCAALAGCQPGGKPAAVPGPRVENGVRPSYPCRRAAEPIRIDGLLTEPAWQRAPSFALAETAGGAPAPRRYAIKMLRDDRYLYVGLEIEDPDVWARCGYRDEECGPDFAKRANWHPSGNAEFQRLEADFHSCDKFVKFFLDPDEDGADYLEFQISPVNNFFDAAYPCGYDTPEGGTERQENLTWKCEGLISATRVDGTLNAPHDQDKGWSAEIAMPWTALARFCKGTCPPAAGDSWLAHVAYVDRTAFRTPRTYWTWPVIGVVQSHMPKTWGRLVFDGASFRKAPATPDATAVPAAPEERFARLFGSARGKPEEFLPKAAAAGATDLLVSGAPTLVAAYAEAAPKHGLCVWAWVGLNCNAGLWKAKFPDEPPPLQSMDEPERNLLEAIRKKDPEAIARHQWGGAPIAPLDVLDVDMLTFHEPRVMDLLKESIREYLAVPGLTGLFLDGWGYQNLRCDRSPQAMKAFEGYLASRPAEDREKAFADFSLESLVGKHNELCAFARSVRPDILLSDHVWPAYAPEPLYGNRLDLDFCGQTAAWYSEWPLDKVEHSARQISAGETRYFPTARGVAFLGFYNRPGTFPLKSALRLEAELKAILAGGCDQLMIHSLPELLAAPGMAEMLKKHAPISAVASAAAQR